MANKTDLTRRDVAQRSLIAYCGLYCATCPGYTQVPANLAKELKAELKKGKFDTAADFLAKMPGFGAFKHYKQGLELLGTIAKMRCPGCKKGGGGPKCKIRICAKQKKFEGCWQCNQFETCKKFVFLIQGNDVTYLKNLRKIKKSGTAEFIRQKKSGH